MAPMYSIAIGWVLASTSGATLIQPEIADDSATATADASATETASVDATASSDDEIASDDAAVASEDTSSGVVTASASADADTTFDDDTESESDYDYDTGLDAGAEIQEAAPAPDVSGGSITPFDGRLGVGAIRTIAGVNGVNIRYFLTDQFMLGASLGVALFTRKENDPESTDPGCPDPECSLEDTRTVAAVAANLEGLYFVHLGRENGNLPFRADFGLGGRFAIMTVPNSTDIEDNLDDPTEIHVSIPLVFQLMFGNNFALSPEMGMDFRINPGSREEGDSNPGITAYPSDAAPGPGFGWSITPGVGLFAGASMHYYFGR